ncbi:unnamed protein product [Vitrella brassicaformis CCMP3155]|uniref:Serine/threonine-protein phosphatase 4 regulatory subunit 2 n=2 Tax=Vitrella brassicaformis TaxID=1169539 RepID=A0A0G4E8I6_VITBC|nr:unnamed protein product [Vitrella brassicaformis CCMP3155]|eukprot:CEL91801.1 unnamed protein product [Vitrella brassicaformis CCMP3155]
MQAPVDQLYSQTLRDIEEFVRRREAGEGDGEGIPEDLEAVIRQIANNGVIRYPWELLKHVLAAKIRQVLMEYHTKKPDVKLHQGESFTSHVDAIVKALQDFTGPPFTIQRLCELLSDPRKSYTSTKKLTYAFERMLKVISIIPTAVPDGVSVAVPRKNEPGGAARDEYDEVSRAGRKRKAPDQSPGFNPDDEGERERVRPLPPQPPSSSAFAPMSESSPLPQHQQPLPQPMAAIDSRDPCTPPPHQQHLTDTPQANGGGEPQLNGIGEAGPGHEAASGRGSGGARPMAYSPDDREDGPPGGGEVAVEGKLSDGGGVADRGTEERGGDDTGGGEERKIVAASAASGGPAGGVGGTAGGVTD